jgi:nifR3 family TIM-barrel protein
VIDLKWKIGHIEIANQVVVAPMAGVSNPAFRSIAKSFDAGLIYSEMVSDKGLGHNNRRTHEMLAVRPDEHPLSMQLFGGDEESLVAAAKFVDTECDADIIDINMGCPVPKVIKGDAGAKLMQYPDKIYAIVKAVVAAVHKPVTVKIRSGWDHEHQNAVEVAKLIEAAGASAIAIHGRTRSQQYSGKADWAMIKAVKQAVKIPVIGNGDVTTPELAKQMLEETGCDAVMIGRGVLGNPWLIGQTVAYLENGTYDTYVGHAEKLAIILRHIDNLIAERGEKIAILEMRSHTAWYLKGLPGTADTKRRVMEAKTKEELLAIVRAYFQSLEKGE